MVSVFCVLWLDRNSNSGLFYSVVQLMMRTIKGTMFMWRSQVVLRTYKYWELLNCLTRSKFGKQLKLKSSYCWKCRTRIASARANCDENNHGRFYLEAISLNLSIETFCWVRSKSKPKHVSSFSNNVDNPTL